MLRAAWWRSNTAGWSNGPTNTEGHTQLQLRSGVHQGEASISVCLPALAPCHVMLRSPSKSAGSSRAA